MRVSVGQETARERFADAKPLSAYAGRHTTRWKGSLNFEVTVAVILLGIGCPLMALVNPVRCLSPRKPMRHTDDDSKQHGTGAVAVQRAPFPEILRDKNGTETPPPYENSNGYVSLLLDDGLALERKARKALKQVKCCDAPVDPAIERTSQRVIVYRLQANIFECRAFDAAIETMDSLTSSEHARLLAYHWTNVCLSREDQSRDQTGIVGTNIRNQEWSEGLKRQFSLAGIRGLDSSHPLRSMRVESKHIRAILVVEGCWAPGCFIHQSAVFMGARGAANSTKANEEEGEKIGNGMQGIGTGTGAKEKATKKRNNGQWESEPRDLPRPKRRDRDHDRQGKFGPKIFNCLQVGIHHTMTIQVTNIVTAIGHTSYWLSKYVWLADVRTLRRLLPCSVRANIPSNCSSLQPLEARARKQARDKREVQWKKKKRAARLVAFAVSVVGNGTSAASNDLGIVHSAPEANRSSFFQYFSSTRRVDPGFFIDTTQDRCASADAAQLNDDGAASGPAARGPEERLQPRINWPDQEISPEPTRTTAHRYATGRPSVSKQEQREREAGNPVGRGGGGSSSYCSTFHSTAPIPVLKCQAACLEVVPGPRLLRLFAMNRGLFFLSHGGTGAFSPHHDLALTVCTVQKTPSDPSSLRRRPLLRHPQSRPNAWQGSPSEPRRP
ncbi:uncharacterized protein CLUP02_08441 [Colletotrichum lupini]|uniref:Uncharacterized protein n=1 Tax=Colletotrichum lupini TaxID=145971 RepID=A0A9Q8SSZ1_9PEZI|nr:uncharacterized protein CLUP02_08441 [Colletotrichum lupini]UQC82951.1 hypothetical protein CLUP02_08441 [Colletotrichum lupini]